LAFLGSCLFQQDSRRVAFEEPVWRNDRVSPGSGPGPRAVTDRAGLPGSLSPDRLANAACHWRASVGPRLCTDGFSSLQARTPRPRLMGTVRGHPSPDGRPPLWEARPRRPVRPSGPRLELRRRSSAPSGSGRPSPAATSREQQRFSRPPKPNLDVRRRSGESRLAAVPVPGVPPPSSGPSGSGLLRSPASA